MFKRYTESARRAIFYARKEAIDRKSGEIETCDLVLGLIKEAHPLGSPMRPLHEDAPRIRALLLDSITGGEPLKQQDIPLTATSKMALAYAAEEANRERSNPIEVHHLLCGVLLTKDKTASILADAGYTLTSLRRASRDARALDPITERAPIRLPRRIRRNLPAILGILLIVAIVLIVHFLQ